MRVPAEVTHLKMVLLGCPYQVEMCRNCMLFTRQWNLCYMANLDDRDGFFCLPHHTTAPGTCSCMLHILIVMFTWPNVNLVFDMRLCFSGHAFHVQWARSNLLLWSWWKSLMLYWVKASAERNSIPGNAWKVREKLRTSARHKRGVSSSPHAFGAVHVFLLFIIVGLESLAISISIGYVSIVPAWATLMLLWISKLRNKCFAS